MQAFAGRNVALPHRRSELDAAGAFLRRRAVVVVTDIAFAVRAGYTLDISGLLLVFGGEGMIAMQAEDGCLRRLEAVVNRNAFVEDKAFALPKRLPDGHVFKILQDAALEVINVFNALVDQP